MLYVLSHSCLNILCNHWLYKLIGIWSHKSIVPFFLQNVFSFLFFSFCNCHPYYICSVKTNYPPERWSALESTDFILLLHFLFHYRCNTLIVPFCRPICSSMTPLTVHLKVLFMLWMIRPWRSMGRRSQLQAKGNVDICHCTRIIWFDCYCAKLSLVFVYCTLQHCSLAILLTRLDFWVLMGICLCSSASVTLDSLHLNYFSFTWEMFVSACFKDKC